MKSRFAQSFNSTVRRSKQLAQVVKKYLPWVNMGMMSLSVVLCAAYILQVNSAVTKGYQIRDLETSIHELRLENQQMEVGLRKVQSLSHVANAIKILRFEPSGTPAFVTATNPSFALAE